MKKIVIELTPRQAQILAVHLLGHLESAYERKNWIYRILNDIHAKTEKAINQAEHVK